MSTSVLFLCEDSPFKTCERWLLIGCTHHSQSISRWPFPLKREITLGRYGKDGIRYTLEYTGPILHRSVFSMRQIGWIDSYSCKRIKLCLDSLSLERRT